MNPIELAVDPCGTALARVQLAKGGTHAVLNLTDYERLRSSIGPVTWFLDTDGKGNFYVRLRHPAMGRNVMVSRLILGTERGSIRYRDGDPLNLRHANLIRPLRR